MTIQMAREYQTFKGKEAAWNRTMEHRAVRAIGFGAGVALRLKQVHGTNN